MQKPQLHLFNGNQIKISLKKFEKEKIQKVFLKPRPFPDIFYGSFLDGHVKQIHEYGKQSPVKANCDQKSLPQIQQQKIWLELDA